MERAKQLGVTSATVSATREENSYPLSEEMHGDYIQAEKSQIFMLTGRGGQTL